MRARFAVVVVVVLGLAFATGAGTAHADDLTLPDGTIFVNRGGDLVHGGATVSFKIHSAMIDCSAGLAAVPRAAVAFAPPGYIATQEIDAGQLRTTACIAGPHAVLVATVMAPPAIDPADATAVAALLVTMGGEVAKLPASAETVALFQPTRATATLTAESGVWEFVIGQSDATTTLLLVTWPLEVAAAVKLTRSEATQRCADVGFTGSKPAWAPSAFADHGIARDGVTMGCANLRDGRILLAEVPDKVTGAAALRRTTALLETVVTALDNAAPLVEVAPPTPATPAAPTTVADAAPTDAAAPIAPVIVPTASDTPAPPPRDDDGPSLATKLRGLAVGVHQLSPSASTAGDSYGVELGYRRTSMLTNHVEARADLGLGYDTKSKAMLDGQLALGLAGGTPDGVGAAAYAVLGGDAIGVGTSAPVVTPPATMADRLYVAASAYYGGAVRIVTGGVDVELAYLARDASATDHEWRFAVGYRLDSGRRIVGSYRSLGGAAGGTFWSLAFAL